MKMSSKSGIRSALIGSILNGVFAVNKPPGITSAKVVALLKAALKQDLTSIAQSNGSNKDFEPSEVKAKKQCKRTKFPKIGHGGTLDMNATGVLVVACGNSTKRLSNFLKGEKVYIAEGKFGKATDTMDACGNKTMVADYSHITEAVFQETLENFTGDIMQVPPVYSALKVNGERMSDLAKRGITVNPKERPVQVFSICCHHFSPPHFRIEVHCGGGFYIRKLIHDIGISLGTYAHMTSLCRTKQGCFSLDEHTLAQDKWTLEHILRAMGDTEKMNSSVR